MDNSYERFVDINRLKNGHNRKFELQMLVAFRDFMDRHPIENLTWQFIDQEIIKASNDQNQPGAGNLPRLRLSKMEVVPPPNSTDSRWLAALGANPEVKELEDPADEGSATQVPYDPEDYVREHDNRVVGQALLDKSNEWHAAWRKWSAENKFDASVEMKRPSDLPLLLTALRQFERASWPCLDITEND